MWKTLIANYETKEWSNTIYVLRRLCQLRYEPRTDMLKHITKVRSTIRELNDMGKTITEQETVEWILITLPDSGPDNFNAFINHLKPTPQQEVKLKTLIIVPYSMKRRSEASELECVARTVKRLWTSNATRLTRLQMLQMRSAPFKHVLNPKDRRHSMTSGASFVENV
ncbi:hypothetical protein AeMF1_017174 [Aphanomyces euteiches]|nr:hypothetical protein AeMF1_017174 [Aphanomyces euteiches]